MFLSPRGQRQPVHEDGAALVVVIGVMAVGLILTAVAMSSVVHGLGFSSATRAGVQSQGAAEAGIAAARAGLHPDPVTHVNNCAAQPSSRYVSTNAPGYTGPVYTAKVERYDGSGWVVGCPTATTTQVRITSTGTARATGVAGQNTGNTSNVEAVFNWLKPGVPPTGVGMYLHGGGTVEANSSLDLSEGGGPGLMIKNGDFYCDKNNSVINGSILVNGNLTFNQNCEVNGDAWVSGYANLGSGRIAHDLTAASVSPNPPPLTKVGGHYYQGGAMPAVPKWAEVGYTPSDWRDELGVAYEVKPLPGCNLPDGTLGGTIPGAPVIFNALTCSNGPTVTNNTTVRLTSDVVIFAQRFNWDVNSLQFTSATSAAHKVWFITPDYLPGNTPSCQTSLPSPNTQGNFTINNGFTIAPLVSAVLYTPCAFDGKNGFTWRGQVYSGGYSYMKNNPSFTFVDVGIAGTDMSTGDSVPTIPYPKPGTVVSIRDLSGP